MGGKQDKPAKTKETHTEEQYGKKKLHMLSDECVNPTCQHDMEIIDGYYTCQN